MGMFDEIRCMLPLPIDIGIDHRHLWFQAKSMNCLGERYEIREDGTLWARLSQGDWSKPLGDWHRVESFTGEITFHTFASDLHDKKNVVGNSGWLELSAYFVRGELKQFELLQYDKPTFLTRAIP